MQHLRRFIFNPVNSHVIQTFQERRMLKTECKNFTYRRGKYSLVEAMSPGNNRDIKLVRSVRAAATCNTTEKNMNNFRSSAFGWRLHANWSGGPSPEPADDGRTFVRHSIRAGFGCVGSETGMAKISSYGNWGASVHEAPLLSISGRCGNNNQSRRLVYYGRASLLRETAGGQGFVKLSHQTVLEQQCLIWILTTLSLSVSNDRFSLPIVEHFFVN